MAPLVFDRNMIDGSGAFEPDPASATIAVQERREPRHGARGWLDASECELRRSRRE